MSLPPVFNIYHLPNARALKCETSNCPQYIKTNNFGPGTFSSVSDNLSGTLYQSHCMTEKWQLPNTLTLSKLMKSCMFHKVFVKNFVFPLFSLSLSVKLLLNMLNLSLPQLPFEFCILFRVADCSV